MNDTMEERFWSKVNKTEDCWNFSSIPSHQYGELAKDRLGHRVLAHRYSWQIHFGDIPDNMLVCHRCDNTRCVNPEHLYLGTYLDNNKDRAVKNRSNPLKGDKNPCTKIKDDDIISIRDKYSSKLFTQQQLADIYNVSQGQISRIIKKTRRIGDD